jgi:diaminopimelate epimerase
MKSPFRTPAAARRLFGPPGPPDKLCRMQVPFFKMHGAGNRIVVVDRRGDDLPPPDPATLRRLGDTATGPGFDQLMWVGPARDASMDASYRVFNADGGEVEQCGNGVRCVAALLAEEAGGKRDLILGSLAGLIEAHVLDDGNVAVNMGAPVFDPERIPFDAGHESERYEIVVGDETFVASVLSMGNPHCVLAVDDVTRAEVVRLGRALGRHPRFPAGVNVGFMHVRDRGSIELRVHERGVGETPACGTGACAAVVAGQRAGLLDESVTVRLPGGRLVVSWRGGSEPVWLTGNAELISEGTVEL